MLAIQNKKYQTIKVFINDHATVSIGPKETQNVNVNESSNHMKDLEKSGLIKITKVDR